MVASVRAPVDSHLLSLPQGRCKGAKAEVLAEAQDAQKVRTGLVGLVRGLQCLLLLQAFLQQLFPSISVEAEHFATWVDEFESRVVDTMQHSKTKVCPPHTHLDTVSAVTPDPSPPADRSPKQGGGAGEE